MMSPLSAVSNTRPTTRKLSPRADYTMPQNTPVSASSGHSFYMESESGHSFYMESDEDVQMDESMADLEREHIQSIAEKIRLGLEKMNQRRMDE